MATPNPKTLTSANVVFLLTVTGLYSSPQQIQGFASDRAFFFEDVDNAETFIGVDGIMSAGWIPRMYEQTIDLQANSSSIVIFETWGQAQDAQTELYNAAATITYPGIGRSYSLSNGVLKGYVPMPEAAKTLRRRTFRITWNTITPAAQ